MPKSVEVKMAIREATRMHLNHQYPYFLGKTMLRQSYRLKLLEKVLLNTQAYILSGGGSKEEAELINVINKVNTHSQQGQVNQQRIWIN
jgi:hypothetical protein